jgi:hypothetical protein
MKWILAMGMALMASRGMACDVCGIFLGVQPHDRTSSVSLLWRARLMEGTLTFARPASPNKHGGHGVSGVALTGEDRYRELYQVLELRADLWLADRFALLVSLPAVNNYRAVNGFIGTDIYGIGDPLLIGRYLVANTKCTDTLDRTVHRLMLGGGAKLPLGRNDLTYNNERVSEDLQPGTGTWDLLASAEYMVRAGRNGAAVTVVGRYNTANNAGYRLGHGLSSTVELFRRWDLRDGAIKLMPSLGVYHELAGRDAELDVVHNGTGSSTLFAHAGARLWWRNWMLSLTYQQAVAWQLGDLMVPNRMRIVTGLAYNFIKN